MFPSCLLFDGVELGQLTVSGCADRAEFEGTQMGLGD